MNQETYDNLVKIFEDGVSFRDYQKSSKWVLEHIKIIATNFSYIGIRKVVAINIDGERILASVEHIYFNLGLDAGVLLATKHGNVWYYETEKPTEEEIKNFER